MKKLKCVLLIDDDKATNFIHERILMKSDCTELIQTARSGVEGLTYLSSPDKDQSPPPDLIFLDINMPAMNGWEFLEEYKKLGAEDKAKVVIVMLTSSLNPDDKERADGFSEINQFMNKPLTFDRLAEVMDTHF